MIGIVYDGLSRYVYAKLCCSSRFNVVLGVK